MHGVKRNHQFALRPVEPHDYGLQLGNMLPFGLHSRQRPLHMDDASIQCFMHLTQHGFHVTRQLGLLPASLPCLGNQSIHSGHFLRDETNILTHSLHQGNALQRRVPAAFQRGLHAVHIRGNLPEQRSRAADRFGALVRQLTHTYGYHVETFALSPQTGRFNGCVQRQQSHLPGDLFQTPVQRA
ncbi:hypothetical protein D3C81_1577240 [compost metagenome]